MASSDQSTTRKIFTTLRQVPIITWVGVFGTVLLGAVSLASGGVWTGILMAALVVLVTAIYGFALRRRTWLRLPRKRSAAAIGAGIAFAVLMGSTSALGATHPDSSTPAAHAVAVSTARPVSPVPVVTPKPTPSPSHVPVVKTFEAKQTSSIPFTLSTVQDSTEPKGTNTVTTAGVNGTETKTYVITYTDGTETAKVLESDIVTTAPVAQVTDVGTYVAPAPAPAPAAPTNCTNGTYVDSAGATVCRPEVSSSAPAGATAKCSDGTYSFSQSRRGTCSSHGGVAEWL